LIRRERLKADNRMSTTQTQLFFDQRFLGRYAGPLMSDPSTALVELVANCWDAYATKVEIAWPNRETRQKFSIKDNGHGMTPEEFGVRWHTLEYDRVSYQGDRSSAPLEQSGLAPRRVYGRNGRGRHAAFLFSAPYEVRTWKDGTENTFKVSKGTSVPLQTELTKTKKLAGHGTEIRAVTVQPVNMSAEAAREILGSRFLVDPNFVVTVDGVRVTFEDVPNQRLREFTVTVPEYGTANVVMIDAHRPDRTTLQHGIAWRVNSRLVGHCGWRGSDYENILDGRTSEAKRYTFIVFADFLADAVLPDWSDFNETHPAWTVTRAAVQTKIRETIRDFAEASREATRTAIRARYKETVESLSGQSRERWELFIEQVMQKCPSISENELEQLAGILANLERSESQYGLLAQLHILPPGGLDELHGLLEAWTVKMAKIALDEIGSRLKLIRELHVKLRDETADEVQELQPLFERGLWIFGPEFETIEFTSNRGMTEVIRKIFAGKEAGSRQRPDFVVTPDSTVGLYSRPSYDDQHNPSGVDTLVIVEIKRVGVEVSAEQKGQTWNYVKELREKGQLLIPTKVHCFVLGSRIDPSEIEPDKKGDTVTITPLLYETFIRRAEKRLLNLYDKIKDAPFLAQHGINAADYMQPLHAPVQEELALGKGAASNSN
jgi:hypothetical protein